MMSGFIGVHIGAGKHSEKLQNQYEKLCKTVCKKGIEAIKSGQNAVDAVALVTAALEDSPLTNAGYGSSLTWDGSVECDASVMDGGRLGFGAVGAVTRLRNPIYLAKSICLAQYEELSLNRVPPCLLVGAGAEKWAVEKGMELIEPGMLVSSKSMKVYKKFKKRAEQPSGLGSFKSVTENRLDTVGALAIDSNGRIAASCSSGGIALKHPGRIGQASIFGCGCWAENNRITGRRIAVSVSGCGEDLIRTSLAKETASAITNSPTLAPAINNSLRSFLDSPYLGQESQRLCGLIAIDVDSSGRGELAWGHTTNSMVIGHMSTGQNSAKCRVSRLPTGVAPGTKIVIEGVPF